jgi:hypothetical protein
MVPPLSSPPNESGPPHPNLTPPPGFHMAAERWRQMRPLLAQVERLEEEEAAQEAKAKEEKRRGKEKRRG